MNYGQLPIPTPMKSQPRDVDWNAAPQSTTAEKFCCQQVSHTHFAIKGNPKPLPSTIPKSSRFSLTGSITNLVATDLECMSYYWRIERRIRTSGIVSVWLWLIDDSNGQRTAKS